MTIRKNRAFSTVLLCLIFLTVGFIFVQSLLPPAVSDRESGAVHGFLSSFLSGFPLGRFVLSHLRKCAHFGEYAVLGFEIFAFLWVSYGNPTESLFRRAKRLSLYRFAALGALTALIDETLQMFSNRGPSITDVWIDFFGYLFGGAFLALFSVLSEMSKSK